MDKDIQADENYVSALEVGELEHAAAAVLAPRVARSRGGSALDDIDKRLIHRRKRTNRSGSQQAGARFLRRV
jgi:hypothetical protein